MSMHRPICFAALLAGAAACKHEGVSAVPEIRTPRVQAVSVSPPTAALAVGETVALTAQVSVDAGTSTAVHWASNDSNFATVTQAGVVTARARGDAVNICATSVLDATRYGCASLSIRANTSAVAALVIDPGFMYLQLGKAVFLTAYLNGAPVTAAGTLKWTSTDTLRVTVSNLGIIFGRTMTKSADSVCATMVTDATKRGCAGIIVTGNLLMADVMVIPSSATLNVGDSIALTAYLDHYLGTSTAFVWHSDDTTRVVVDAAGRVTARSSASDIRVCAASAVTSLWWGCAIVNVR